MYIEINIYIFVVYTYIDKGTIERECEFNTQHHKNSLNNAFVLLDLLFFFQNNTYACICACIYR